MDINTVILEYYSYPQSYDNEDEQPKKKSSFGKILGGAALAGLGAGAVAASQTHGGKAVINGGKAMYHKWRAKANLQNGNIGGAISHGASFINNGAQAAYHYFNSPTLRKLT